MKPVCWTGYYWSTRGCAAWFTHARHGGGLSACVCWVGTLLWAVPGEMVDSVGLCTPFLWGNSRCGLTALVARRSSEGWKPVKGKTNKGLSPLQKFQFYRNSLISWIKIREEGRDFFRIFVIFFFFPLPSSNLLCIEITGHRRAGMCEGGEWGWLNLGG